MKYFYANGAIHPFEDGEIPQWARMMGEDSDFRVLSEEETDAYTRQQGINTLGFDMSAAQWAGNEQAMVQNPATGQMELIVNTPQGPMLTSQAQAAGIQGTPLMKPAEESSLSQWTDFLSTPPIALALAAYGGSNMFGGLGAGSEWAATAAADDAALGALFSGGEVAAGAGTLAQTFPLPPQTMPTGVELGAGGAGSTAWNVPGLAETSAGVGGAATAATSATEEAMLQAARTQQLNTIAGNGMTGMASGLATGLPGLVQNGMDALGVSPGVASTVGNVLGGAATGTGGYQIPWGQIAGGLMEYAGANQYGKDIADAMKYAVDKADPAASQRPFYQGELRNMFTDPNYFSNAPLLKGANQNAISDTSRALASQGYNMSGNVPVEIAQRLQNNNMTYGLDLMNKTGGFAGMGFGPGQAGTIAATGGTAVAQAGQQGQGALGSIFQNVLQGQQPTSAQQVRGTQPNQTLQQYLFA